MTDIYDALARAEARRPTLAEPEPDEIEDGDSILLVNNGYVRVTIAGIGYKLRRPFLGELRELEATMDAALAELKDMQAEWVPEQEADVARAEAIQAEARSNISQDRKQELDDEITMIAVKANERQKRIWRRSRELREEWWAQAFEMLTPLGHKKPEMMPAWVADPGLQNTVIDHWQMSPLARGSA